MVYVRPAFTGHAVNSIFPLPTMPMLSDRILFPSCILTTGAGDAPVDVAAATSQPSFVGVADDTAPKFSLLLLSHPLNLSNILVSNFFSLSTTPPPFGDGYISLTDNISNIGFIVAADEMFLICTTAVVALVIPHW